jgi:hypothetical protein
MKSPPHPPPRPRDTLDDAERELDAVHEITDPIDPLREAPTDLEPRELGTHTDPLGSRELPTGPAEQRTAPWMHAAPWASPEAPPPETKKDPFLLPVVVFVLVLLACIGLFLYQETHKGMP